MHLPENMIPSSVSIRALRRERLEAFEAAVRTVYASTMDISALEYRKQRGLQHSDEQMAVPMQNRRGGQTPFFSSALWIVFPSALWMCLTQRRMN